MSIFGIAKTDFSGTSLQNAVRGPYESALQDYNRDSSIRNEIRHEIHKMVQEAMWDSPNPLFKLSMEEIENGYVLHIATREGERFKKFLLHDLEEMLPIVCAQVAVKQMLQDKK